MRMTVLGAIVAALLSAGSSAALAHAMLSHAEPRVGSTVAKAPAEVSLTFTQDLEPTMSTVQVIDASGQRMQDGLPRVTGNVIRVTLRPLAAGSYRVQWRVLSVDMHATEGSFSFRVRD